MTPTPRVSMHTAMLRFSEALERYAHSTYSMRQAAEQMQNYASAVSAQAAAMSRDLSLLPGNQSRA